VHDGRCGVILVELDQEIEDLTLGPNTDAHVTLENSLDLFEIHSVSLQNEVDNYTPRLQQISTNKI
jgi:hypothetical protein